MVTMYNVMKCRLEKLNLFLTSFQTGWMYSNLVSIDFILKRMHHKSQITITMLTMVLKCQLVYYCGQIMSNEHH